jgi:GNAT superfamily N-acetyltransferase
VRLDAVAAAEVRPLRAEILRPGQAPEELCYAGDEAADTLHVAVRGHDALVAIASVMRDPYPGGRGGPHDWRIRGMATRADARGAGLGAALLARCEEHAACHGGRLLWCNARIGARSFYERAGMRVDGAEFEIAGIGPHLLMCKRMQGPQGA